MSNYPDPYRQPPGYYSQPLAPTAPVSGLAIAAMVTGIIGDMLTLATCITFLPAFIIGGALGVTAVVLGHYALQECKNTEKTGRGFAIAGIACGWSAIGVATVFLLVVGAYVGFLFFMFQQAANR